MPVRKVGVVGAGVMGAEIALITGLAGLPVKLRDVDDERLEHGLAHARKAGERLVRRGHRSDDELEAALSRIVTTTQDAGLADCDLVVEAVPEIPAVKETVLGSLDEVLFPEAIIASNTSGLSITALGAATSRPDRVVGLHFFNPPTVMDLVEVVRGSATSDTTLARASAFVEFLGKTGVPVAECPGFLVNRILIRAMAAAYATAEQNRADPAGADAAVSQRGPAPMGAFALGDLVGLDTYAHIQRDLVSAYGQRFDDVGVGARMVAEGRLGRKSGGGFFAGPPSGDDPTVGDAEIAVADAYYAAARDEATRCIDENVARPKDVSTAMKLGAGWSSGPLDLPGT